jgi:hypothetical protein
MTDQGLKLQFAEVVGTWVAATAVVIGGLFGIYQYLEHKSAVRVERSMAFVERYHSNNMLVAARLTLTESITERTSRLNRILQDTEINPDDLPVIYNSEVLTLINEDKLSGALDQIFTFYEQILLCREMDLCDEEVAKQFFDIDAEGFVNTYYPYICKIRKEWHNPKQFEKVTKYYSSTLVCPN